MSTVASATTAAPSPSARPPVSRLWFWLPILPLVALDLWSKAAVFGFLDGRYPGAGPRARHLVFDGVVRFDLVRWHNTGTIWGLFQGYNMVLVVVRCVAVLLIVAYGLRRVPAPSRGMLLVLGGILAGALGNLYDNFTETEPKGGVRDFLFFTFFGDTRWEYGFPAFNVADACISVGVCCLLLSILFEGRRSAPDAKPSAPTPT